MSQTNSLSPTEVVQVLEGLLSAIQEADMVRVQVFTSQENVAQALRQALDELRPDEDQEPRLIKLTYENGKLNILASHPWVALLAAHLSEFFKDAGGINYVELTVHSPDESIGELVVTVQRKQGKTPHELRMEAEKRLLEVLEKR